MVCGQSFETPADGLNAELIAGRRMTSTTPRPIEVYRPLHDPDWDCEVWVCRDSAACKAGYDVNRVNGVAPAELELLGMGNVIPIRRSRLRTSG